ncbi:unnamed protein product, partial [Lymnaea stagnalis]
HVHELPYDILLHIFSFLETQSKIKAAQVCKKWRDVVYSKTLWRSTLAKTCLGLREHANLFTALHDRGIVKLSLQCELNGSFKSDMESLNTHMPQLRHLEFELDPRFCSEIVTNGFKSLRLIHLQTLDIKNNSIVDSSVIKAVRVSMPSLRRLSLRSCLHVNNTCLKEVAKLTGLMHLDLACNNTFTDEGLAYVCGLTLLESGEILCSDDAPVLSTLHTLNIEHCSKLTSLSVECLGYGRMASLNTLIINYNEVMSGVEIVDHIVRLKSLRCLCALGLDFSNDSVKVLAERCSQLENLFLPFNSRIGDTGLRYISQSCKNVIFLSLIKTAITDDGVLEMCAHMPQLLLLDISNCQRVTDLSLRHIGTKLCRLQVLLTINCVNLTSRGSANI